MGDMNNDGNDQDKLDLPKDVDNFESFDDSNAIPLPSYKNKKSKNIVAIALGAVILIGGIAGFLFRGYLVNQVMFLTKTPAEYYAFVEHKSIGTGIDFITKDYSATSDQYKKVIEKGMGSNVVAELSISPEYAGLYGLSDIGNVKIDSKVFNNYLKQQISTEFFYKDQSLLNLNALYNLEDLSYYLQVPEISNAYLLFDLLAQEGVDIDTYSDVMSNIEKLIKLLYDGTISPEKLNQLLTKYTDIVIDALDNVEHNGDATLSIADTSGKYTSLTVQMDGLDFYEIELNFLNTVKKDNYLQDLVVNAGITTTEEFTESIDKALQSIEGEKDSITNQEVLYMTVYVDNFGNIIGREFTSTESSNTTGYYAIRKGTTFDFNVYVKQDGASIMDITGDATYASKKISGHATITIDDTTKPIVANLEFKDLAQIKNTQIYNGTMTLTSDNFNGISLGLDLIGSADTQQMNFKMLYGNIEGATLNISAKEIPYTDIVLPAESEEVYNATTDIYGYMNSMDLTDFIDHVYKVTGYDLSGMLYGLMGF